ncbi:hypothetical protein ACFV0R_34575 [Streptomyces sp. NPDC059578]|uniref:hypothetical protein n=1 Tax=Streptomyces sp. NPDC059578 TaxID=3346874 RepID=UPI0036840DBD
MDDRQWFGATDTRTGQPQWYRGIDPPPSTTPPPPGATDRPPTTARRRLWPTITIVTLVVATIGVWQQAETEEYRQERQRMAAKYKGQASAELQLAGVEAEVWAHWAPNGDRVALELHSFLDKNARFLRIEASGKVASTLRDGKWHPVPARIKVPITDRLATVTVHVAVGGKTWKPRGSTQSRTLRLSPDGLVRDATTGEKLSR